MTDPERMWRELVDVRAHGFATERNESMIGLSCVAAPVFGPADQYPVAAVSVSLVGAQMSPLEYVMTAQNAARGISSALRSAVRSGHLSRPEIAASPTASAPTDRELDVR